MKATEQDRYASLFVFQLFTESEFEHFRKFNNIRHACLENTQDIGCESFGVDPIVI